MAPDWCCYRTFLYLLLYNVTRAHKHWVFLCVFPEDGWRNRSKTCVHLNSPHFLRAANQDRERNLTGTAALKSGITNSSCFRSVRLLDYSQKLTIYWSIIPSFAAAPVPDGPLNHFLGVETEFWEHENISEYPGEFTLSAYCGAATPSV